MHTAHNFLRCAQNGLFVSLLSTMSKTERCNVFIVCYWWCGVKSLIFIYTNTLRATHTFKMNSFCCSCSLLYFFLGFYCSFTINIKKKCKENHTCNKTPHSFIHSKKHTIRVFFSFEETMGKLWASAVLRMWNRILIKENASPRRNKMNSIYTFLYCMWNVMITVAHTITTIWCIMGLIAFGNSIFKEEWNKTLNYHRTSRAHRKGWATTWRQHVHSILSFFECKISCEL